MCDHVFAYHSVIPPTHCPKCGRCLGCGGPTVSPWSPYPGHPWYGPYTMPWRGSITYTSENTT